MFYITEDSSVKEISEAIKSDFECYAFLLESPEVEEKFCKELIPQAELYEMFMNWLIENDECIAV